MGRKIGAALLLAGVFLVTRVQAENPPGAPDDHVLCYKARTATGTPKFEAETAFLADAFETLTFDVLRPMHVCSPADVQGEGVVDAATHLESYKIRATAGSPKHVRQTNLRVVNQFGSLRVDTIRPDLLLVPSAQSAIAPPPAPPFAGHGVDHYKCYKVRVTKGTSRFPTGVQRTVSDSLVPASKLFDVKTPRHLCTPVSHDLQPVKNGSGHLLCYKTKPAAGQPKHLPIAGLFTADTFGTGILNTIKEDEICVPSIVNPACGDGVRNDSSEECDGADDASCPGQCTPLCACPDAHPFVINPASSQITVRGALGLNSDTPITGLSGSFTVNTGGQSPAGVYEVSVPVAALPPVDVLGLATGCVYLVEHPDQPGSGISGTGILNCSGVAIVSPPSPSLSVHVDHCTNGAACDSYPVGSGCSSPLGFGGKVHGLTGVCVPEGPPDATCSAVDPLTGTAASLEDALEPHPGVCRSPLYGAFGTAPWAAGDAFVTVNVVVEVRPPGDTCAGGPTSAAVTVPLTTGTVRSTIMDAFPGSAPTGKVQALQMTGTPFDCTALLDGNSASGAALVATFAALDQNIFSLADLNVGLVLTAQ